MNSDVLRGFCHRSREWSRATRGVELFNMVAEDLREFGCADAGFFVYRKRLPANEVSPKKAAVYVPWGVFVDREEQIQMFVDDAFSCPDVWNSFLERRILFEDLPAPLQRAGCFDGVLEVGIWPLGSRESLIGVIVVVRTRPITGVLTFETGTALMDFCSAQVSLALDLILTGRLAEEASRRDFLTGLLNRRGLKAKLPQLVQECQQSGRYLIFELIDLDNLKQINDSQGHLAGDDALCRIADIIRLHVRENDVVVRLGGDEFMVLLQSDEPNADAHAKWIRRVVEEQSSGLSVSVGGAVWGVDGVSFAQCYLVADERLYLCKGLQNA